MGSCLAKEIKPEIKPEITRATTPPPKAPQRIMQTHKALSFFLTKP